MKEATEMKVDIIVISVPRYKKGHEANFVPPITGIHLAALTPNRHQVRVIHQQVDPIDYDTDADLIAMSFFSGFANEAYRMSAEFRRRGKTLVAGGPHASFCADEALGYFDSVVIGEAENVWVEMLDDAERGELKRTYEGGPCSFENVPTPRYDLLPKQFVVKKVIQATRGCPYSCSFCTVPSIHPGFRMRPVSEIIRDIKAGTFKHWWERKMVWFWDDNLTANRKYVKELLREMIPLKKWWLTQASIDIAQDTELLDLMQKSGCIGVFLGIETLSQDALASANKKQNKVDYYRKGIAEIHKRGICVMAGFMSGFDDDTPEAIVGMADRLYEIGVDVPFLSVLTPFKGTSLHSSMSQDCRMIEDRGWEFYNGYNVVFQPIKMTSEELQKAHHNLWMRAFSPSHSLKRAIRGLFKLRFGAMLMCTLMNLFYGLKQVRGNTPRIMSEELQEQAGIPVPVVQR